MPLLLQIHSKYCIRLFLKLFFEDSNLVLIQSFEYCFGCLDDNNAFWGIIKTEGSSGNPQPEEKIITGGSISDSVIVFVFEPIKSAEQVNNAEPVASDSG